MKEKLTLPERPSLLHLVGILDILVLLLVFFVLVTSVAQQAGIAVDLPKSGFRLGAYSKKIAVTVKSGSQPIIYVGMKRINSIESLREELELAREKSGAELVVIDSDRSVSYGVVAAIREIVLEVGLQPAMGAEPLFDAPKAIIDDEGG